MDDGKVSLADRREAVSTAVGALTGLRSVLFQSLSDELADVASDLAELRALCGAGLAAVTAEAESRGVIASSQYASATAWLADLAPHSRREASTIAKTAAILGRVELEPIASAVVDVTVDLSTAVVVASEFDKLAPDLQDCAKPVVLQQFVAVGGVAGPAGARQLKEHILAQYGEDGVFEDHQERCRRQIDLSAGRQTAAGIWNYRLTVDNEGRAVLESAIGPLSAPKPNADSGERDMRPVARRRGDALIAALQRSVTAATHVPTSPKATLMVTMSYADLAAQVGAGKTLGSRAGDCWPVNSAAGAASPSVNGTAAGAANLSVNSTAAGAANLSVNGTAAGAASSSASANANAAPPDTGLRPVVGSAARIARNRRINGSLCGVAPPDEDDPPGSSLLPGIGAALSNGSVVDSDAVLTGGVLLAPRTVRKLACDAAIIPVVLGSNGEILDQGRAERLFTPGQVRDLWLRDQHCTFAGCTIPAAWCDAHHLVHWSDGGATNLDNAALLCPRHHTIVHRDELAGKVTHSGVAWDRRPGSYRSHSAMLPDSVHRQRTSRKPRTSTRIMRT